MAWNGLKMGFGVKVGEHASKPTLVPTFLPTLDPLGDIDKNPF